MFENKYVNEFMEEELKQATSEFWENTKQAVQKKIPQMVTYMKNTFSEVFADVANVQKENNCKVGKITISLLRVSAWEEKKRAKIEVYDENEIIGKLLYEKDLDISVLFEEWDKYRFRLIELAEKKGVRRYIKDPVIRLMMGYKLTDMASYLYGTLKYILMDADEIDNFALIKKEPGFAITVGEYQDWQRVVYIEMPPIDLENPPDEYPMVFGHFEGQTYKRLRLINKNLEKSKFINCKFISCIFEDVNLNDVRFIDCIFQDVQMKSGTMFGAVIQGCKMLNSDISGMQKEWIPFKDSDEEEDIYQNFLWIKEEENEAEETEG